LTEKNRAGKNSAAGLCSRGAIARRKGADRGAFLFPNTYDNIAFGGAVRARRTEERDMQRKRAATLFPFAHCGGRSTVAARFGLLAAAAMSLAACGLFDALIDGWKHVQAVEADLEKSIGTKPAVGFNWNNGRLTQVTVTFPRLLDAKPLRELAVTVRRAVTSEFQQTPQAIVLGFTLDASEAKTAWVVSPTQ
jgi:hypothetical protein